MTARYLLDTNICIYIRRRKPAEVLARFNRLKPGEAILSVVTYGELLYGAEKSQQRAQALERLQEFTEIVPVAPLPLETAAAYGSIRAGLEAKGAVIGNNDLWIAAHAKAAGLIVVTNDEHEFARVPGLKVQNWARGA